MKVNIKRLSPDAQIPQYAHASDACFDLVAAEDVVIEPGETALVKTGLAFEIPVGYEMQIRPRSGITLKTKLRVQLGTVDAGYRGEVGVVVDNIAQKEYEVEEQYEYNREEEPEYWGSEMRAVCHNAIHTIDNSGNSPIGNVLTEESVPAGTYIISKGDRIAQAVIKPVEQAAFTEVTELDDSDRGAGGFGSSGVN
ncbi:deoxyuridine 5'-triphosphate nucleotidohydrolase [Bacillus paralicheniformis]|uniref:dUTP diphosphatase n=1 Tax=Bacillus paralicheniformis TaxID=1648923 RepID=UPI0021F3FE10|nr:deoxyuridine 5'-triphosphate nucleotidohydrolase [Bacillus paralicheniformis]MCV9371103.1 deoxyuridine 5'-triphosphate nucleotidohydrolase [Bacillus paralicheniformis]WIG10005.1 deoxyuridine 5'-triphosphate nucleotidohydrolase [Bacillus paralicheniformis]